MKPTPSSEPSHRQTHLKQPLPLNISMHREPGLAVGIQLFSPLHARIRALPSPEQDKLEDHLFLQKTLFFGNVVCRRSEMGITKEVSHDRNSSFRMHD